MTDELSLRTAELRSEMQDLSKLADSFSNKLVGAFAGAIIHGRNLSDVMKGLVLSLSQTALSAALKPVGNLLGNLFSKALANANGNVISAGRVTPFASGGADRRWTARAGRRPDRRRTPARRYRA